MELDCENTCTSHGTESDCRADQEGEKKEENRVKFLSTLQGKRGEKWMMCHCQE